MPHGINVIRNSDLHCDFYINLITEEIKKNTIRHNQRHLIHDNIEMAAVIEVDRIVCCFKRPGFRPWTLQPKVLACFHIVIQPA